MADAHCLPCALKAFGRERDRPWVREDPTDAEGNPVGAISSRDGWCDLREPGHQVLACGTCGALIAEHDHEPPECDCDAFTAMAEFAPTNLGRRPERQFRPVRPREVSS
jgi:hypothetical protein